MAEIKPCRVHSRLILYFMSRNLKMEIKERPGEVEL